MSYRIAVCDDRDVDAEYVSGIVRHWAQQRQTELWRINRNAYHA